MQTHNWRERRKFEALARCLCERHKDTIERRAAARPLWVQATVDAVGVPPTLKQPPSPFFRLSSFYDSFLLISSLSDRRYLLRPDTQKLTRAGDEKKRNNKNETGRSGPYGRHVMNSRSRSSYFRLFPFHHRSRFTSRFCGTDTPRSVCLEVDPRVDSSPSPRSGQIQKKKNRERERDGKIENCSRSVN